MRLSYLENRWFLGLLLLFSTLLDRYLPYVVEGWAHVCHNIAQIYQELFARGYKDRMPPVYCNLVRHLSAIHKHAPGADARSPTRTVGNLPLPALVCSIEGGMAKDHARASLNPP